ncbi:uncharacterized protein sha [Anabrus simplex]|uniref:uncharacterized protein sha n=1 Tax=Anabrus simplex TaxID=316456 RepID=UPI0035A2D58A
MFSGRRPGEWTTAHEQALYTAMRSPLSGLTLLLLLLLRWRVTRAEHPLLTINRHHKGDMFVATGSTCSSGACAGNSGGTAAPAEGTDCACQCLPHLPVFRDDLQICIDDIHECTLAPFISGSTSQRIPFVFLPLEGQIVHPSAEISFSGVSTPICVVSSAQFLTRNGWADLRNNLYTEPPFRLFRDEGRTFLQWLGEVDLRLRMEGRLILVHLLCKDVGTAAVGSQDQTLFSPCVAFRVAGSPRDNNVPEVSFPSDGTRGGLTVSEYVAIGVCSILLGLIYVASVLLYLHVRRRRRGDSEKGGPSTVHLASAEEGVVKSNPLHHHLAGLTGLGNDNASYLSDSASCSSDTDNASDNGLLSEDSNRGSQNAGQVQVTSAVVHSCTAAILEELRFSESMHVQDNSSFERLPEENVSIVETPDGREERPETVRAMSNGVARRKLYFNPAFFEPELLLAPPPAAVEFLTKIREVICIARQKMAAKRFAPSLIGIPEESNDLTAVALPCTTTSPIPGLSLKRENSRRRGSSLMGVTDTSACLACCPPTSESKQNSIRRWLEDVPVGRANIKGRAPSVPDSTTGAASGAAKTAGIKRSNSKLNPAPAPPVVPSSINNKPVQVAKLNKSSPTKLPSSDDVQKEATQTPPSSPPCPVPPPMPSPPIETKKSTPLTRKKSQEAPAVPVVAKKLMDAVIKELIVQTKKPSSPTEGDSLTLRVPNPPKQVETIDFEADSLERSATANKESEEMGMATPSDYGDVPSQPSPSLSSALPLEEELTMRNEIFNIRTGSTTISKLKLDAKRPPVQDDHDYEIIVLNPEVNSQDESNKDIKLYSLPELLNNNDGYSLVSEVYVNDDYNFSSTPSSPGNTSSTSSTSSAPKIRYSEPGDKPGHLTIELEDSPDNYLHVADESDSFEPDTLDRKPSRRKKTESIIIHATQYEQNNETFTDSLERPSQILLRTTGSFRSDSLGRSGSNDLAHIFANSPLNRAFGSLREIYEARTRLPNLYDNDNSSLVGSTRSLNSDGDYSHTYSWKKGFRLKEDVNFEGILLNPEAKQARRQRSPTPPSSAKKPRKICPPEIIPPLPPKSQCLYQEIPPPRPIHKPAKEPTPPLPPRNNKPPLPPKNGVSRSTSHKRKESNPARRPLPPLPKPSNELGFDQGNSTISSTSSVPRDFETLSIASGASVDSLNSSDYEAFYTTPFSGDEEVEGSQTLGHRVERSLNNKFTSAGDTNEKKDYSNQSTPKTKKQCQTTPNNNRKTRENVDRNMGNDSVSKGMQIALGIKHRTNKDTSKHIKDKRNGDPVKKAWRRGAGSKNPHKPEDSGYLSTDSNESTGRRTGSISETDESLCDGASESGGESIATDSFFFGSSFKKLSACEIVTESVDSGVGSDLIRTTNNSVLLDDIVANNSDSDKASLSTVTSNGRSKRSAADC